MNYDSHIEKFKTWRAQRKEDVQNYTPYTDYTLYTMTPEKSDGTRCWVWLIRSNNKRTRPMMQAQACNPVESGPIKRQIPDICTKQREPIISDKLACSA